MSLDIKNLGNEHLIRVAKHCDEKTIEGNNNGKIDNFEELSVFLKYAALEISKENLKLADISSLFNFDKFSSNLLNLVKYTDTQSGNKNGKYLDTKDEISYFGRLLNGQYWCKAIKDKDFENIFDSTNKDTKLQ